MMRHYFQFGNWSKTKREISLYEEKFGVQKKKGNNFSICQFCTSLRYGDGRDKEEYFFDYDGSFGIKWNKYFVFESLDGKKLSWGASLKMYHFSCKLSRTMRQVVQEKSLSFDFDVEFIGSAARESRRIWSETVSFCGRGGRKRKHNWIENDQT